MADKQPKNIIIEPFIDASVQMCNLGKNTWSVPRLFELSKDLDIMDIPIKHLNIVQIYDEMSLRELVGHMMSANNSDLSYPIILDEDGEIMDGRHRLMKALLTGQETIKAVRFDKNPEPCQHTE